MDKSWMIAKRTSGEYQKGVDDFIAFGIDHGVDPNRFICPCKICKYSRPYGIDVVKEHLICDGIIPDYKVWIWHGEKANVSASRCDTADLETGDTFEGDRVDEMLQDVRQFLIDRPDMFDTFITDAQRPLYDGCTRFTRLSAVLKLYNLKAGNGWTDKSFSETLEVFGEMLPKDNCLPRSAYEAKKLLKSVGLEYQKIHACPNDCVLYRKEHELLDSCPVSNHPRYKSNGAPLKAVWYFPIRPRFRRLFGNCEDAKHLTWHANGREADGKIRHPADASQWKEINRLYPEFAEENGNLRLALSTDGMSPYGNLSSSHSTWPVELVIYNLPPWLCMKRKYMMLSLLIAGPKQPGNDIDVYLAPLVEDLKDMWENGIEVYDAYSKKTFCLRAMLFCTINDFPAYGNLAGYSVKGYTACPICEKKTFSIYLPKSKKNVYLGHRRFLPLSHRYRRLRKAFNGSTEEEMAPLPLLGQEVLNRVREINVRFGKKAKVNDLSKKIQKIKKIKKGSPNRGMKKRASREGKGESDTLVEEGWKKRSIFFDLPYWKDLFVRHCLDVMHIEKNVCESVIGTLLNVPGKTKDGVRAREDYVVMQLREELAPEVRGKRTYLPPACYTLSKQEKEVFCKFLHDVKVPEGFSSNISSLVSMKDLKLIGAKSHDCHVLMQQLLPCAIRSILLIHVRRVITKLCFFFKRLCSKIIDPDELDGLQTDIANIVSEMEMYFPFSFFDIMLHLTVHLVREVELCGPVYLRWMYPFERYMKVLKGYVMNRNHPEGCIVQRYIVEEAAEFCASYLSNVEAIGLPKSRYARRLQWCGTTGYEVISIPREKRDQAHLYVLHNMEEVQPYVAEHMAYLRHSNPRQAKNEKWITTEHNRTFMDWFRDRVVEKMRAGEIISTRLQNWSKRPRCQVMKYNGFVINNCTFSTKDKDDKTCTQNSGVTLIAQALHMSSAKDKNPIYASMAYYGFIEHIWVLLYSSDLQIPVFCCKWVDSNGGVRVDEMGIVSVCLEKLGHKDEPFILASQAKQVFYVRDLLDSTRSIVMSTPNRSIDEDFEELCEESVRESISQPSDENEDDDDGDDEEEIYVRDDHDEGLWFNEPIQGQLSNKRKCT